MEQFVVFITNHWMLSSLFALALVVLAIYEFVVGRLGIAEVATERAVQLINHEKAVVLDLRSEALFAEGHILGSIHLQPSAIDKKMGLLDKQLGKPLILVCATGQSSVSVCDVLQKKGFQLYILSGGIQNWKVAGLPLVKR